VTEGHDRIARRAVRVPEIVTSSYLGYPLRIGHDEVEVFTPAGRRVCSAVSVKQARLVVRAYRREGSRELRAVGDLAERTLDGTEACSSRLKEPC
jgi:hypothetical protein